MVEEWKYTTIGEPALLFIQLVYGGSRVGKSGIEFCSRDYQLSGVIREQVLKHGFSPNRVSAAINWKNGLSWRKHWFSQQYRESPMLDSEVASHGQVFVSASLLQLAVLSVLHGPKHRVRGGCLSQDPKRQSPIIAKLEGALAMNFTFIHCVFREHLSPSLVLTSGPGPQGRIGDSVLIPILRFSFIVLATEAF